MPERAAVVTLRRYQPRDVSELFSAVRESLPECAPWLPWVSDHYAIEDSAAWIAGEPLRWENGIEYGFAIVDGVTGAYYGGCGLNLVNRVHNYCNLGYWIRTSAAGKGIATEATRQLAAYGLDVLRFTRIEILAAKGNVASQRVAEKAGARREGVLRNRLLIKGDLRDAVLFSLVPGDV